MVCKGNRISGTLIYHPGYLFSLPSAVAEDEGGAVGLYPLDQGIDNPGPMGFLFFRAFGERNLDIIVFNNPGLDDADFPGPGYLLCMAAGIKAPQKGSNQWQGVYRSGEPDPLKFSADQREPLQGGG